MTDTNKVPVAFAAIDPYIERNIVEPTEKSFSGSERVQWGRGDKYPVYILDLCATTPTLQSVISGCVDFIAGDDVRFKGSASAKMNRYGRNPMQEVRVLARSQERLGGFAIEVVRGKDGKPLETFAHDASTIRSNKDNSVFWYSEKWGKNCDPKEVRLPLYLPKITEEWAKMDETARANAARSLVYVKNDPMRTYPSPCFAAAVKAAETERGIDDYHLNALDSGFSASAIINFTNGIPSDEQKAEIERDVNEKMGGHANAGRILLNFAPSKEQAAFIQTFRSEDFGEKYAALSKHCRQQLYTAFRANPNLFGIPTESLGFSSEEYESAFRLFNRTHVRPIQRAITDAYEFIFGEQVLEIVPFTLDGAGEASVK